MSNDSRESLREIDEVKAELISENQISVPDFTLSLPTALQADDSDSSSDNLRNRWSAPPSPNSSRTSDLFEACRVKQIAKKFETLNFIMAEKSKNESAAKRASLSGIKGWVTRHLKQLQEHNDNGSLGSNIFKMLNNNIQDSLNRIVNLEIEIEIIYKNNGHTVEYKPFGKEVETFIGETQNKLAELAALVTTAATHPSGDAVTNSQILKAMSQMGNGSVKVNLDCPTFSGDEKDRLEFKNWLAQFEAVIKTRPNWTEEFKITYLKSKVIKNANNFIAHLEPEVGNYVACISALKEQYLDEPFIVDEYFKKLCAEKPEFDETYGKTRVYIATIRNNLHNLKTHFNVDLLEENSGGHKLLSHIIFTKLSPELRQAFSWECKNDYPSFKQILDTYCKVINSVVKNKRPPSKVPPNRVPYQPNQKFQPKQKFEPNYSTQQQTQSQTQNFIRHCRFCAVDGHSSVHCESYVSQQERINRCNELELCTKCTHPSHKSDNCPGNQNKLYYECKFCKGKNHVAALCSQRKVTKKPVHNNHACLSTGVGQQSNYLLPVISMVFEGQGGKKCKFNALLDTGSSRSYINPNLAKLLAIDLNAVPTTECEVRTFLGSGTKKLGETSVMVHFPSGRYLALPIFIDEKFNLNLEVRGLSSVMDNLNKLHIQLGADYPRNSNKINIEGLVGTDLLQFIPFSTVPCMFGQAIKIQNKLIPFGNSAHFLYQGKVQGLNQPSQVENNYHAILAGVHCPDALVNNCFEPKAIYPDGLAPFFDESLVERRIERMLNCDSLGAEEVKDISQYDKEKIEQFKSAIQIKDQVFVELIWKDNIDDVPSNHQVSLKVLERVYDKLEKSGQLDLYNNVFFDQLEKDIIQEFHCSAKDFHKYNWLPHRPVIKQDAQSTFKVRPVFNCSLKTRKDKPSLNEASYAGVNIMQDMLDLLLRFRTNANTLLGDLEKAFLQIRLKLLSDKNKFCFFLKDGNKIRCFRYNTLLFGYVCSPFILNYVIQHVASLYPDDQCSQMIKSNFFVDNLAYTSNSPEKLTSLYKECSERLGKVHFNLLSCNTNNKELKEIMKADQRYIKHGCERDKVLGYRYDAMSDSLFLNEIALDKNADTKRKILAASSSLFDPISFSAPVSIRSKILLSKLWEQKKSPDHWDVPVSEEHEATWTKLASDIEGLSALSFPRESFSSDSEMDLVLFCDASTSAYGYVAYAVQGGKSNLVLAKAKVAPLKKRSLPQLELLGALTGVQGLLSLLNCFNNVKNIFVGLDAQICLSWITSPISTKNVYTANRIKDIKEILNKISVKFNKEVYFRYVPTLCNPGDMLTRGTSLVNFKKDLSFWLQGPDWLRSEDEISWPSAELGCLNSHSKALVCAHTLDGEKEPIVPIIPFDRYSKLTKLLNTQVYVLKFLKLKGVLTDGVLLRLWGSTDLMECAKVYLILKMQKQSFEVELEFLRGVGNGKVPDRVRDLNIFLDKRGLLRCDGRMGKVESYDPDMINPILLGKNHPLTNLIILNSHSKVKHLGIQPTLNRVRMDGFRLIHPINSVKQVLRFCYICKKMNALAFKYPKMTDLPAHRINLIRPYSHVGVDYTGHVMVREGDVELKYYFLIYTCMNVRACHIDLVPDMSALQFVLSLVRFCNLYGIPDTIYSDNAPSFSAGTMRLGTILKSDLFKEHFGTQNIQHNFIPLGAPWVGATWERMIKTIKTTLRKSIGRQRLDYFKLKTALSDVQHAVNCRPLTYRCAENNGLEVIAPINFLNPYGDNGLLVKNSSPVPRTKMHTELSASLQLRDELLDKFKQIWYEEYLMSLRDSYKDLRQENFVDKIKRGDIVLLKNIQPDLIKHRQYWSLARVVDVICGSDGRIRSARVLKASADYLRRKREPELHPINHLFPLELNLTHDFKGTDVQDLDQIPEQVNPDLDFSGFESEVESGDIDLQVAGDLIPSTSSEEWVENPLFLPSSIKNPSDTETIQLPLVSSRGRRIIPKKGNEDFVSH